MRVKNPNYSRGVNHQGPIRSFFASRSSIEDFTFDEIRAAIGQPSMADGEVHQILIDMGLDVST